MGPKEYHYKFNIPLVGIFGFVLFVPMGWFLLDDYFKNGVSLIEDPSRSDEYTYNAIATYVPLGAPLLFVLCVGVYALLIAWRSFRSLTGKDCLPLVFDSEGLTKKTIMGSSVSISWAEMDKIALSKEHAWVRSKTQLKCFKIFYAHIEGLDEEQLIKDISRYNPNAKFST